MFVLKTGGRAIEKWTDWPGKDRMQSGRSAQSLAEHWTSCTNVPSDVQALLDARFGSVRLTAGEPEYGTSLPPKGSRGPRMHDLWLMGRTNEEQVTICIEAKADESFDQTIAEYKLSAKKALSKRPNSQMEERLGHLQEMVWSRGVPPSLDELRYQLLSALSGTAIQTEQDGSQIGVLLFHVFETDKTTSQRRFANDQDLFRFVETLDIRPPPANATTRKGHFIGSVAVRVGADFTLDGVETSVIVHLAKLVTSL